MTWRGTGTAPAQGRRGSLSGKYPIFGVPAAFSARTRSHCGVRSLPSALPCPCGNGRIRCPAWSRRRSTGPLCAGSLRPRPLCGKCGRIRCFGNTGTAASGRPSPVRRLIPAAFPIRKMARRWWRSGFAGRRTPRPARRADRPACGCAGESGGWKTAGGCPGAATRRRSPTFAFPRF